MENKKQDLYNFQKEITQILENEIISRYYYQKGQIEASIQQDKVINAAIETLKDKKRYDGILEGTSN